MLKAIPGVHRSTGDLEGPRMYAKAHGNVHRRTGDLEDSYYLLNKSQGGFIAARAI